MSTTVEQILNGALAIIDELNTSGGRDLSKTADYAGKTPKLVDMYQKELIKILDYYTIYEVARKPVDNLIGNGFDVIEYLGEEQTFEVCSQSKTYYFETDSNTGIAYIEDYTGTWNIIKTISMTNITDGFKAYSGTVIPTSGATISRIRFTGINYYRITNIALFDLSFDIGKEPVYMPFVKVSLPSTVSVIKQVILEYPNGQYASDEAYKIERDGNLQYLYVDYNFTGKIRVQYKPIPTTITALTDILQIDDISANLISYRLAGAFMRSEQNFDAYNSIMNDYETMKAQARIKQPVGTTKIIDYYNCGGEY